MLATVKTHDSDGGGGRRGHFHKAPLKPTINNKPSPSVVGYATSLPVRAKSKILSSSRAIKKSIVGQTW